MSESIGLVASAASTLYYGGFRPSNGALNKNHFVWLCAAADSKIKQDEYDQQVRDRMRVRLPATAPIILSDDNYMNITVDVKDNKAKLPFPIMNFTGDNGTLGIMSVKPVGACKQFIRIRPNEDWQVCDVKDVVFWMQKDNCTIEFINMAVCNSKRVDVRYIGQLNGKGQVQESRKFKILNLVIAFIKSAKEGTVIDMSNDGNANVASQTEINKFILKALQER